MTDKKKSNEMDCLNRVLRCEINKGEFALSMHQILTRMRDRVDCNGERPDIIINTDSEIIGIEHCLVDMLFWIGEKDKKTQSMVRIQQGNPLKFCGKV